MSNLDVEMRLKLIDEASKPSKEAAQSLQKLDQSAKKVGRDSGSKTLANDLKSVAQNAKQAGSSISSLAGGLKKIGGGVLKTTLGAGGISLAGFAAMAVLNTRAALQWERTLYSVGRRTRLTGQDLDGLEKSLFRTSRNTGVAKEELAAAVGVAAKAQSSIKDLGKFTEYAAKTSRIWGMSTEDNAERLSRMAVIYKLNQQGIERLGDTIEYVSQNSTVAQEDILEFLDKGHKVAISSGMNAESLMTWGIALKDMGLETNDSVRMLEKYVTTLGSASKGGKDFQRSLGQIGLNARTVERAMKIDPSRTLFSVLQRVSKTKNPLQTLRKIFGDSAHLLEPLLNNLGALEGKLNGISDAGKSASGAVAKTFGEFQGKNFSQVERANEVLSEFRNHLGNIGAVSLAGILKPVNDLANDIDNQVTPGHIGQAYYNEKARARAEIEGTPLPEKTLQNLGPNRSIGELYPHAVRDKRSFSERWFGGNTKEEATIQARLDIHKERREKEDKILAEWDNRHNYQKKADNSSGPGGDAWRTRAQGVWGLEGRVQDIQKRRAALSDSIVSYQDALAKKQKLENLLTFKPDGIVDTRNPFQIQASMDGFKAILATEGDAARATAYKIASDLKNLLSFDAQITITPTLSAPGVSAPVAAKPSKHASVTTGTGVRPIQIGSVNVTGVKNLAGLQREVTRVADARARGQRDGALHDIGTLT